MHTTYTETAGALGSGLPGAGTGYSIAERARVLLARSDGKNTQLSVHGALDQARDEAASRMLPEGTIDMNRLPAAGVSGAGVVGIETKVVPVAEQA